MSELGGLWIAGRRQFDGAAEILSKAAKADEGDARLAPYFADPVALEIIETMIPDWIPHHFDQYTDLGLNIALRIAVIEAMRQLCSGDFDGDYAEAADSVPPTIGTCQNIPFMLKHSVAGGEGSYEDPFPFKEMDQFWTHMGDGDPWTGLSFRQQGDVALAECIARTEPFRGECAGALQLSLLRGTMAAYGEAGVDALGEFGVGLIGPWFEKDSSDPDRKTSTPASALLSQTREIASDYRRGAVLAVPGDYVYFKNKDDYFALTKGNGGWQGENCIYMGTDELGGPHYSGMGLAWKTEFALRMFLTNAYINDCNQGYLGDLRNGKTPTGKLHVIDHPEQEVRFTVRAVLRFPEPTAVKAPVPEQPAPRAAPPDIDRQLQKAGFTADETGTLRLAGARLGDLADLLGFDLGDLQHPPKSSLWPDVFGIVLGNWHLILQRKDHQTPHPAADETVDAIARSL